MYTVRGGSVRNISLLKKNKPREYIYIENRIKHVYFKRQVKEKSLYSDPSKRNRDHILRLFFFNPHGI